MFILVYEYRFEYGLCYRTSDMCDNFLKGLLFVGLNTLLFKQFNLRKVIVEVRAVLCAALTQEQ